MRTLRVGDAGLEWAEREIGHLQPGELRVRVHSSAVTGLDRDVAFGRTEFRGTPGHCFVGIAVDGNGATAGKLIGHRVVPARSWGCGVCDTCTAGFEERCPDRNVPGLRHAHGGHAEEVVVAARAMVPVDDRLTDEAAVLLPILAGFYSGIERANLPEWTNVLVIGDGGAGLLAAAAYASAGYTVTLRGRHGDRFDMLRHYRVNFNLVGDEFEKEGLRPGRYGPALMSYPFVVEASGHPSGWLAAAELVSPGGTILMVSSANDGVPRPIHRIQEKNVRIVGLREGSVEAAMEIVASGLFDPTRVITRIAPFDDALELYEKASSHREWIPLLQMTA